MALGAELWGVLAALIFCCVLISSTFGLLGGALLLLGLSFLFDFSDAMFIHGSVQLVAAFARGFTFRSHLKWSVISKYAIGFVIASALIFPIARNYSSDKNYILLALLIVLSMHIDFLKLIKLESPKFQFIAIGGIAGFLGPLVGVVGPVITPFFIKSGLTKEDFVANKTTCQSLVHLAKFVIFFPVSDAQNMDLPMTWVLICLVSIFIAPIVGKWILSKLSKEKFESKLNLILYLIALGFIVKGVLGSI